MYTRTYVHTLTYIIGLYQYIPHTLRYPKRKKTFITLLKTKKNLNPVKSFNFDPSSDRSFLFFILFDR